MSNSLTHPVVRGCPLILGVKLCQIYFDQIDPQNKDLSGDQIFSSPMAWLEEYQQ